MLSFSSKTLLQRSLLQNGYSSKTLLPSSLSIRLFSSSGDSTSFTVSYLINSCGLSQEKAISASKKIHFETSTKPDSVLTLFRNNGFPNIYVSKIIQQFPRVLVSDVERILQPKIEFFISKGLSGPELAKVLSLHPTVMKDSLENRLIPSFDFLKSIVHTEDNILALLKRSIQFLSKNPHSLLAPNIALLRAHGVPDSNIAKLLVTQPRALLKSPNSFKEVVEQVKKMEFVPSRYLFLVAVHALTSMSRSTLEAKFDVYGRWGWSEDDIRGAFKKQPLSMAVSEKKIMRTMDYLVNKMGYNSLSIAKTPGILLLSPERRIFPRCSVIQVLTKYGLVEKERNIAYILNLSEKEFLKKFVTKFEEKVPELSKVYQGKGN